MPKSFLERFGLVESTQSELSLDELKKQVNFTPEVEVPKGINLEGVLSIDDIYEKYGLTDKSKSIFKVDEFSSVLPKELPTEVRRTSVMGILSASGLSVEGLVSDAIGRTDALNTTLEAFTQETQTEVADSELQITELEQQIDALKTKINDRKKAQETQENLINEETAKIEKIVKFVNPSV